MVLHFHTNFHSLGEVSSLAKGYSRGKERRKRGYISALSMSSAMEPEFTEPTEPAEPMDEDGVDPLAEQLKREMEDHAETRKQMAKLQARLTRFTNAIEDIAEVVSPNADLKLSEVPVRVKTLKLAWKRLKDQQAKPPPVLPTGAKTKGKGKDKAAPEPPKKVEKKGCMIDITTLNLSPARFHLCPMVKKNQKLLCDFPNHIELMGGEYFLDGQNRALRVCGFLPQRPKFGIAAVPAKLLEDPEYVFSRHEYWCYNTDYVIDRVGGDAALDTLRAHRIKEHGPNVGVWPDAVTKGVKMMLMTAEGRKQLDVCVTDVRRGSKQAIRVSTPRPNQISWWVSETQLDEAKAPCDSTPRKRPRPSSPPPNAEDAPDAKNGAPEEDQPRDHFGLFAESDSEEEEDKE